MKTEVTLFSAKTINSIDSYSRFSHAIGYIRQYSDCFKDEESNFEKIKELMLYIGYTKLEKFREHRREWDRLERRIPLTYLKKIGVDQNILLMAVTKDQEEFVEALKIPLYPKSGIIRIMAAIYKPYTFPDDTPETEAIEMMKQYSKESHFRCCIDFPQLKIIWIEPDGQVCITYYKPTLRMTKQFAIPENDGTLTGTCHLG